MDDLRRLTAHARPCVEAIRRHEMPAGYTVALQQLAISAFDSDLNAALIELTLLTRNAIREVLDDTRAPAAQRDLALHLWAADADGKLGRVLTHATIAVNDEYDTSPSRPNLGAPEDC
jgi:hypothetical protein